MLLKEVKIKLVLKIGALTWVECDLTISSGHWNKGLTEDSQKKLTHTVREERNAHEDGSVQPLSSCYLSSGCGRKALGPGRGCCCISRGLTCVYYSVSQVWSSC